MNQEIKAMAEVTNDLAAKLIAVEIAAQAILQALPQAARKEAAADIRRRAASAMQEHAGRFSPAMDAQLTLSIAALLEAAGEPPQR